MSATPREGVLLRFKYRPSLGHGDPLMAVNVRYMVNDVDAAVAFYTTHFGFKLLSNAPPAFADVTRGDLRLLLSGPTSSAGCPMPAYRVRAAGTGSNSLWTTSRRKSSAFARPGCGSATISLRAPEDPRS